MIDLTRRGLVDSSRKEREKNEENSSLHSLMRMPHQEKIANLTAEKKKLTNITQARRASGGWKWARKEKNNKKANGENRRL